MNIKIIACEVIKEELLSINPIHNTEFHFIPMGFHLYPQKLYAEMQQILAASSGYERVVLAFGLCGGASKNLRAPGTILSIPRVHDCIPVLLGSAEIFKQHQSVEKGTFYLSCGWFKSDKNILSEHKRLIEKYGEERARKVTAKIYSNYRRVLYIRTGHPEDRCCYGKSEEAARLLNLDFQTTMGQRGYIERIVNGPWNETEFINVQPGGILEEDDFFEKKIRDG